MGRTFVCPAPEQLRTALAPALERLRQALALPDELESALLLGPGAPPQNLLRLAHVLPASEAHHGNGPLGLVQHACAVAATAAELQRARQNATDDAAHALRSRAAVAFAGLICGLGRLWRLEVQVAGRTWSPHRYLADVVADSKATSIQVRHLPGHVRTGPGGDGALALAMLGMVVPLGLLPWLGRPAANQLFAILAGQGGGDGTHLALLDEARQRCLQAVPPSGRPAPRHEPGSGTLADEFAAGLAKACAQGALSINQVDAHLLVSATHTVLFLTMPDGTSALQHAYAAAGAAAQQARVGGLFQAFYAASDGCAFLDEVAPCTLPDGTPWCVAANASAGAAGIRHLVTAVARGGASVRTGPAIILRNAAVPGLPSVAPGGGFDGRIWCGADANMPSADPEDLGFLPAAFPEPPRTRRADAPAQQDASGSVLDARWTTALLMDRLETIAPALPPEDHLRWQRLRGPKMKPDPHRIAEERLAAALEACLERVDTLKPRQDGRETANAPATAMLGVVTAAAPLITALVACARQAVGGSNATSADNRTAPDAAAQPARTAPTAEPGHAVDRPATALPTTQDEAGTESHAEPLHALCAPDGAVFLPWPHCFDQLVAAPVQITLASAGASCATALGLPPPRAVRVAGFTYNGARRQHVGLVIPASWRSPVAAATLTQAPRVVTGTWVEVG